MTETEKGLVPKNQVRGKVCVKIVSYNRNR